MSEDRPASAQDVHNIAGSLPHVVVDGSQGNEVYQVGGKTFVFFRNPRKDALDPETGERLTDVIMLKVADAAEKEALVRIDSPFFTTSHFDGYDAVLVRAAHLDRINRQELREVVTDAWLSQASPTRRRAFLDGSEA